MIKENGARGMSEYSTSLERTTARKEKSPLGADQALFGGSAYIVATREFVQWATTNQTVLQFLEWSKGLLKGATSD